MHGQSKGTPVIYRKHDAVTDATVRIGQQHHSTAMEVSEAAGPLAAI